MRARARARLSRREDRLARRADVHVRGCVRCRPHFDGGRDLTDLLYRPELPRPGWLLNELARLDRAWRA